MKHKATETRQRFNRTLCLNEEMDSFMQYIGMDSRMHDMKILETWSECVGESIARFSSPVELRKGKLFVSAESAAWRYELSLRKADIMDKLNLRLGKKLIKDIIFV